MNSRWWGIVGDGVTDESAQWNTMLANSAVKEVIVSKAHYRVTMLQVQSDTTIEFEPGTIVEGMGVYSSSGKEMIRIQNKSNVNIIGNGALIKDIEGNYPTSSQNNGGIGIRSCTNVKISGLIIEDMRGGDGIYLGIGTYGVPNINCWISNTVIRRCNRDAISVINANGLWINDCKIEDIIGYAGESGIHFEANNNSEMYKGIFINNLYTKGCRGGGINISSSALKDGGNPVDITIDNHTDEGSSHGFVNYYQLPKVDGRVTINNPNYIRSSLCPVLIYGHSAQCYRIDINKPYVIDCFANNGLYRGFRGVFVHYRHSGESVGSTVMGNVHITNATVVDTRMGESERPSIPCFIYRDGSEQIATWTGCSIIDPLRLDYKGSSANKIAAYNLSDIIISDKYDTLAYNFSGSDETLSLFQNTNTAGALVTKIANRNATGDNIVSLGNVAAQNVELEVEVLANGMKISIGSAFYRIRPLMSANGLMYSDQLGAKVRLRKDTAANYYFIVDIVGVWYDSSTGRPINIQNGLYIMPVQTSSIFISYTDVIIPVDATSASDMPMTLPTPVGNKGKVIIVKKIDATNNTIRVQRSSTYTIDGRTTFYLFKQNDTATFISNGVDMWMVLDGLNNEQSIINNSITSPVSKLYLNTNHGFNRRGFVLHAPNMTGGGKSFIKVSDGITSDWRVEDYLLVT